MKKCLAIIVAVMVVLIGIAFALQFQTYIPPVPPNQDKIGLVSTWFAGIGAFGTVGSVIFAMFGADICKFLNSPRLDLEVSNLYPHADIGAASIPGKESEECIEICADVKNIGASMAKECQVYCEKIYTEGADGKYTVNEKLRFRPITFNWIDGCTGKCDKVDISMSLHRFVRLVEIRNEDAGEFAKAPDPNAVGPNQVAASPCIFVCLPDRYRQNQYIKIERTCKSIIIPISVVCVGKKSLTKYIKIKWDGEKIGDYRTNHEKLAASPVSEGKLKDILKN